MPVKGATVVQDRPIPPISETNRADSLNSVDEKTNKRASEFFIWLKRNANPLTLTTLSLATLIVVPIVAIMSPPLLGTAITIEAVVFILFGLGVIDLLSDAIRQHRLAKDEKNIQEMIVKVKEYQNQLPKQEEISQAASYRELLAVVEPWRNRYEQLEKDLKRIDELIFHISRPEIGNIKRIVENNEDNLDQSPNAHKVFESRKNHFKNTLNRSIESTQKGIQSLEFVSQTIKIIRGQ